MGQGFSLFGGASRYAEGGEVDTDRRAEAARFAEQDRRDAELPEELVIAAAEVLSALGMDYGGSPMSGEAQRREFYNKARRAAGALHAFFSLCDSMPHEEGEHEGADDGFGAT